MNPTVIITLLVQLKCVLSLNNGLALTPPMGWLSWERFGCQTNCQANPDNCISQQLFIQMADRLVRDGYRDAGYTQVNIDDCWMSKSRSTDQKLLPDGERFPNGIKYLANYMHSRGLKLGVYQNFGVTTCMRFPGLIGHSKIDAETFADWQVDMVKLDGCFTPVQSLDKGYKRFGRHLNATGRPMIYSCSWPYYQLHTSKMIPDWKSIASHCNLWRTFHDIHTKFTDILATIDFTGDNQEILTRHVGPGSWNDPDMLLIGNAGLTVDQAKVQMGVWAVLAAPLFMSNDLRDVKDEFKEILLNKEVIAINQDKLGIPGKRIFHNLIIDIWTRKVEPVRDKRYSMAIALVNRRNKPLKASVKLQELGLDGRYKIRDLFEHKDWPSTVTDEEDLQVKIEGTGIRLLKAELVE